MGSGVLPQPSEIHQLSSVHPFGCADDVFYVEFSCEECYTCKKNTKYALDARAASESDELDIVTETLDPRGVVTYEL